MSHVGPSPRSRGVVTNTLLLLGAVVVALAASATLSSLGLYGPEDASAFEIFAATVTFGMVVVALLFLGGAAYLLLAYRILSRRHQEHRRTLALALSPLSAVPFLVVTASGASVGAADVHLAVIFCLLLGFGARFRGQRDDGAS